MSQAVIGSGNIGTDLLIKIVRGRGNVTAAAMIGIDPESEGLARARRLGVRTSADGRFSASTPPCPATAMQDTREPSTAPHFRRRTRRRSSSS